ncbi:PglL family O-oligosaccharyltransferase [Jeongeupia naejangsanensis]|uniref:O-antigen ligase C-terminal domain-containing protein n=1 Tax=Jeongeupia naejangsanensis TaxID=613195 RepID=A0ABS2BQB5_9NEIS|nr:Wzy polymerase domain-containing protein [Jeongeupia naejangsanensis]MBM3117635.1 O-antigen ligase C-terminal domain-containing protein [Jeongeupia naejangsanensis]
MLHIVNTLLVFLLLTVPTGIFLGEMPADGWAGFLACLLVVWVLFKHKRLALPIAAVSGWLGLILLTLWRGDDYLRAAAAIVMAMAALMWIAGRNLASQREVILDAFALGTVCGALSNAAAGIIQFAGVPAWLDGWVYQSQGIVNGHFAQANNFASFVLFGAASIFWLLLRKKIAGFVALLLALPMAVALSLTTSRTMLLILSAWILMAVLLMRLQPANRKIWGGIALFGLSVFCGQWLVAEMGWSNANALARTEIGGAHNVRLQYWHQAWMLITEKPWFGWGLGHYGFQQWQQVSNGQFPVTIDEGVTSHCHNFILQVLAEYGIAGLMCVTAMLIPVAGSIWKNRNDPAFAFVAFLSGAVLIHSLLEFPLWYTVFLMPFCLLWGLVDQSRCTTVSFGSNRQWAFFFLVFVLMFWGGAWLAMGKLEKYFTPPQETAQRIAATRELSKAGMHPMLHYMSDVALSNYLVADNLFGEQKEVLLLQLWQFRPFPLLMLKMAMIDYASGDLIKAKQWIDVLKQTNPRFMSKALEMYPAYKPVIDLM